MEGRMTPEQPLQTWQVLACGAVLLAAFLLVVLVRNRAQGPAEPPPVPEHPTIPKSVRDRLAKREAKPKMTQTAIRKRREWARLAHGHDQELAAFREAQGAVYE